MNLLDNLKKGSQLSIVKDPFKPEMVDEIHIFYMDYGLSSKKMWRAKIKFVNGNTKGEQNTGHYPDLGSVLLEMQQIVESLKQR